METTRMIQVVTKKDGATTRQFLPDTKKATAWIIREKAIMAGATVRLKSVGEAVATARRADRATIRAVLTKVFDEESARGNPYAAFSQALKAIAD